MAALLLAPEYVTAQQVLDWTDGAPQAGEWNTASPHWTDAGNAPATFNNAPGADPVANRDSVTFGPVGGSTDYTVTVTAGGNGTVLNVNNITFDVVEDPNTAAIDSVEIIATGTRSLNIGGVVTVNDNSVIPADPNDPQPDQAQAWLNLPISGTLIKQGDGALILLGTQTIGGVVRVEAGRMNVGSGASLTASNPAPVQVLSGARLSGPGELTGNVTVNDGGLMDGSLKVTGNVTVNGPDGIYVSNPGGGDPSSVSGLVSGTGLINAFGGTFDGGVNLLSGGRFVVQADTTVAGVFDNAGAVSKNAAAGTMTLGGAGLTAFNNTGSIAATDGGTLTIDADTINLNSGSSVTGSVNMTGAVRVNDAVLPATVNAFVNTGVVTGSVTVAGTGSFTNGANTQVTGTIQSQGDVTVSGGTVGALSVNGGTAEVSGGSVTTVTNSGGFTLSNNGSVGTLTLSNGTAALSGGVATNVNLNGGTVTFTGTTVTGTMTSAVDYTLAGVGQVNNAVINANTARFASGNVGGTVTVAPTTGDAAAVFESSRTVGGGLTITGGNATHDATVQVTNNSVVTFTGAISATHDDAQTTVTRLTVDNGSTLSAASTQIGEDVDVVINGTLAGGTVTNNDGQITNAGVISAAVTNTAGTVLNQNSMTGGALITGGTLTNEGAITIGTVRLNGDTASLEANAGSSIATLVTNDNGSITGAGGGFAGGVSNADIVTITADTSGGTFTNRLGGNLTVDSDVNLAAAINQTQAGATVINGTVTGGVTIAAGSVALNGGVIADGVTTGDGVITGTVGLTGTSATLTTTGTSDDFNAISAQVTNVGQIDSSFTNFVTGVRNNTGGRFNVLENTQAGVVTNNGGTVLISAARTLTGDLDNDAGVTTQSGTVDGDVTIAAGTIDNTGSILGGLELTDTGAGGIFNHEAGASIGTTTVNNGGTLNANGGSFGAGGVENAGGTLNVNTAYTMPVVASGGTVVIAADDVVQAGVQPVVLTGNFTQSGAATTNNGEIVDDITMTGGSLTNTGLITGGVSVGDGTLNAQSGSRITGLVSITGGDVVAAGGLFDTPDLTVNSGSLSVTGNTTADVTNAGGTVTQNAVALTGTLDNQLGTATLAGTVSGPVSNSGGQLRLNGATGLTITNTSGLTEVIANSGATLNNQGGTFRVNGGTIFTGPAINTSGDTVNLGQISGSASIAAGTLRNAGNLTGTLAATGGVVTLQSGQVGQLVTNNGAEINVEGGTLTTGAQNNAGEFDITGIVTAPQVALANGTLFVRSSGRLNGSIDVSGGVATLVGTVTGTLDLDGGDTFVAGRVQDVVTINTGAALTANAGAQFDQTVQSLAGDFVVNNSITGDINNAGGALLVQAPGDVDGDVAQVSGTAINNGVIRGTVGVTGGTFTQVAGANTRGLTTHGAGTLNASGGRFEGGIRTTGGAFVMSADTQGTLVNAGNNVELTLGNTWIGTVTNTSGNLIVRGDVAGAMTLAPTTGTALFGPASSVSGEVRQLGGVATINGGDFGGEYRANGGSTIVNGAVTGRMTLSNGNVLVRDTATLGDGVAVFDGLITQRGTVSDLAVVGGGVMNNLGTLNSAIVRNDGVLNQLAGSGITAATTVQGGRLVVSGGSLGTVVTVSGGVAVLRSDVATNVNVTSALRAGNNLVLDNGIRLTGNVNNAGRFRLQGILDGDLVNRGVVNLGLNAQMLGRFVNRGRLEINGASIGKSAAPLGGTTALTATGTIIPLGSEFENGATGELDVAPVNVRTGTFSNEGTVRISNDKVLFADVFDNLGGGSVALTDGGGLDADIITAAAGSTITMDSSDVEGAVTMLGDLTATGAGRSFLFGDLALEGEGSLTVGAAGMRVDGTVQAGQNTRIALAEAAFLGTSGLTNQGVLTMGDGAAIGGRVTNTGRIIGNGALNFNGGLSGAGTVRVAGNDSTADRINVGGSGVNGGRFELDVDLTAAGGRADQIVLTNGAGMTGNVTLAFTPDDGIRAQQDGILVVDANGGNLSGLNLSFTGLPQDSSIRSYAPIRRDNGDVIIVDQISDGIAGLAGSISVTQSLIGSVVNRPSSPFVSGLALADEDPCGAGLWARATGGQAQTSGTVTQGESEIETTLDADYYGVQLGGDWACFNGYYNGWDIAFGGILGTNLGNTIQPVFDQRQLNVDGGPGALLSTTDVEFQQIYGGVYTTAVQGPWALDLQYRLEQTDFTANSIGQNGNEGLGLDGETFTSDAQTLSGAVAYVMPLEEYNLTFVPTAGFSYSRISTDPINFGDDQTGEIGVVEIEDFESRVGFIGATLARSTIGDDGVSAINKFVTGTYYNDFAPDVESTFTSANLVNGEPEFVRSISSENLGAYGELSAGLSYVRILQENEFGAVRQFNASVRADVRYSDQLESWGLTAQARFQF